MEGPTPVLKVKGKDNVERNIFEVGSGVGQVASFSYLFTCKTWRYCMY